tara:strand:+ start:89 stop:436 length:348 start_codon:yes stop_codon:yes gene_type:complete
MAKRQTLFQVTTKWTNLGTKSFKKLHVNNWSATTTYDFKLAGLKPRFANMATGPTNNRDGIMICNIKVPPQTSFYIEDISVGNITSTIGTDKKDDWILMAISDSDTSKVSLLIEV